MLASFDIDYIDYTEYQQAVYHLLLNALSFLLTLGDMSLNGSPNSK